MLLFVECPRICFEQRVRFHGDCGVNCVKWKMDNCLVLTSWTSASQGHFSTNRKLFKKKNYALKIQTIQIQVAE